MTEETVAAIGPASGSALGSVDWSVGRYETTAAQLLPAAEVIVRSAALRPGERVLDLGCGTGNVALLAAGQGARVIGVDPAMRLLEVAHARTAAEHKDVTFLRGEAATIPADDGCVDVVISAFAVIFADPAAAAEVSRVLTPRGRFVLSAWLPSGAIAQVNALVRETVREATDAPPAPRRFAWHDPDALAPLLAQYGFRVEAEQQNLTFTAASAQEHLDTEIRNHPFAVTGFAILERLGKADALRARLLKILEEGNEATTGFQVTSPYLLAVARRDRPASA